MMRIVSKQFVRRINHNNVSQSSFHPQGFKEAPARWFYEPDLLKRFNLPGSVKAIWLELSSTPSKAAIRVGLYCTYFSGNVLRIHVGKHVDTCLLEDEIAIGRRYVEDVCSVASDKKHVPAYLSLWYA